MDNDKSSTTHSPEQDVIPNIGKESSEDSSHEPSASHVHAHPEKPGIEGAPQAREPSDSSGEAGRGPELQVPIKIPKELLEEITEKGNQPDFLSELPLIKSNSYEKIAGNLFVPDLDPTTNVNEEVNSQYGMLTNALQYLKQTETEETPTNDEESAVLLPEGYSNIEEELKVRRASLSIDQGRLRPSSQSPPSPGSPRKPTNTKALTLTPKEMRSMSAFEWKVARPTSNRKVSSMGADTESHETLQTSRSEGKLKESSRTVSQGKLNRSNTVGPTSPTVDRKSRHSVYTSGTSNSLLSPTDSPHLEGDRRSVPPLSNKQLENMLNDTGIILRGTKDRYMLVNQQRQVVTLEAELMTVLEDPVSLNLFKVFLDQEYSTEALLFWMEVEAFRKLCTKSKMQNSRIGSESNIALYFDISRAATTIYNKYLASNARFQVNIDSDMKLQVEERLKTPSIEMFDEAQTTIFSLMKNDSFRRFRNSPPYLKHLEHQQFNAIAKYLKVDEEKKAEEKQLKEQHNQAEDHELNFRTFYDGEEIPGHSVCSFSVDLLCQILTLYKKHEVVAQHHRKTMQETPNKSDKSKRSLTDEEAAKILEITCLAISLDPQYKTFATETQKLQKARLEELSHVDKLVFFTNIFNVLCLHAQVEFITSQVSSTIVQKMNFYKRARYRIGGLGISMAEIEHAVLRNAMCKPNYLGLKFSTPKFSKSDARYNWALTQAEPLVSFALFEGTASSPTINVYTTTNWHTMMAANAKEYLGKEIEMIGFQSYDSKANIIKLPRLIAWYGKDFGNGEKQVLQNLLPYLPQSMEQSIRFFLASVKIKYKDYMWKDFSGNLISNCIQKDFLERITPKDPK